ncbi:maleylacetoacetate isomerase [Phenylobacterium sp.]|uniref:maleylacetoacetate isomerase n=1 Tax=Phenylobacterium sp. TaxID=1871053 RepID=UPI0025F602D9|nr:maleylacetoacetate isomerase [Phenylobacterium sp.]MBX3482655.1 maleylacetoacetate isomerase [Phenylobacterium sp.]MCW5759732.1 maleylacetoacetate isomerase [Phenylobacterium sp.]
MTWTLYSGWRAGAAYRVRIGLKLKGCAYDYAALDLVAGDQRQAAYRAVNPQGLVPALDLGDGTILAQSLAILEWLEETVPEPPLLPRTPLERAMVRRIAGIIACDIHPANNTRIGAKLRKLGVPDDVIATDWIQGWIRDGFDALEPLIARYAGRFAFGDQPTIADCCLIPQVYSAHRFGLDVTPYPAIVGVAERANQHPAFIAAHPNQQPDAVPA